MENFSDASIKRVRIFAIFGALALVLIGIVSFFISNAVVFVSITGQTNNAQVTTYTINGDAMKRMGGSGLFVIPRNTQGILVSAGDSIKTQTKVSIPWFGIAVQPVQLNSDKNADKVAFAGPETGVCATYATTSDKLSYYDCPNPTALMQYQTPSDGQWANKSVASLSYISSQVLPPYMGGVIGITLGSQNKLSIPIGESHGIVGVSVTATITDKKASYNAPSEINSENIAGLRLFTDTNNPSNNKFVLVDAFGTIYLGTPASSGKTVDYKRISAPEDYNYRYNQTICSLEDSSVYCYRGYTTTKADSKAVRTKPSIVQLTFADGVVNTTDVQSADMLDGFYTTTTGKIYGKNGKSLYSIESTSGKYAAVPLIQTPEAIATDNKLYFVQDNGVYELDDTTHSSHQIFYSSNITVKSIYPVDGKLYVFGSTKNSKTISAYLINDKSDTTPGKRLIDAMPLNSDDISGIASSDLVGDKVLIKLNSEGNQPDTISALKSLDASIDEKNIIFTK
jgi:hypothetical protein